MSLVKNIGAISDADKVLLAIQDSGGGAVSPNATDATFTPAQGAPVASVPVLANTDGVTSEQLWIVAIIGAFAVYHFSKKR